MGGGPTGAAKTALRRVFQVCLVLRVLASRLDALRDEPGAAGGDENERQAAQNEQRHRQGGGAPRVQLVRQARPLLAAGLCRVGLPALGACRRLDHRVRADRVPRRPLLRDRALQGAQDVVVGARVRRDVRRQVLQRVVVTVPLIGAVDPAVVPVVQEHLPAGRPGRGARARAVRPRRAGRRTPGRRRGDLEE